MSQVIAQPQDCCNECPAPSTTNIPGPQGPAGANGTNGTNGVDALTTVANYSPSAQPVMPAEGGSVTVNTTSSTAFMSVGEPVFVENWGTMFVTVIPSASSVTLQNPANTASGFYLSNAAPGTSLAAASKIVPGGEQGEKGADGTSGAPDTASYWTRVAESGLTNESALGALATGLVKNTTGTGVPSIAVQGTDYYAPGGTDVAVADGGTGAGTASGARTNLGLGTIATQAANNVAVTGGAIDGTVIGGSVAANGTFNSLLAGAADVEGDLTIALKLFTKTSGIQSLLAATSISPDAAKIRVVGNGGPVTLTATPTISPNPAVDGQHLFIMGQDDVNTVTLQSEASLTGSKLQLGASTRVLGKYDMLHLVWDFNFGKWCEVAFTNN